MRISIFFAATLATLSTAQSITTTTQPASSTVAVVQSPAQVSQAACLLACPATDPNCRQTCVSNAQVNTIDCIGKCPKGTGTAAENLAFENCQKACIAGSSLAGAPASTEIVTASGLPVVSGTAVVSGTGVLGATGSAGLVTGSRTVDGITATATATGNATLADASVTATGNAGERVRVGGVGVIFGLGLMVWL